MRESVKKMKIRRMPLSGVFPPATYVRFATIVVTDVHGGFQYVGDKGCFSVESRGVRTTYRPRLLSKVTPTARELSRSPHGLLLARGT